MPYDNHIRLTCSGVLQNASQATPTPFEQFSFRLNLSDPSGGDNISQGRADDYAADCVAFFADSEARISAAARLLEVKVARIGADGKYREEPRIVSVDRAGAGVGGLKYPPQIALAVSLNTGRRGPTGRGRFYLPAPTVIMEQNGRVTDDERDRVAGAVVTFLRALNNVPNVDSFAPKVTIASSKGYNTDVTGVRVGRVLDTIRSRREDLVEEYESPLPL